MPSARSVAPVFDWFPNLRPPYRTLRFHTCFVLLITYVAYASLHGSRKPPSIIKSVFGPPANSSNILATGSGWAPFNGTDGTQRLGELDLTFLLAYSFGMYFSGHIGDRTDLRLFLFFGMMGSGIFTMLFGLGYWLEIHTLWFFICVQVVCGLFQSIGWPCVVAIVGNWRGRENQGLIMGLWSSHTWVGNIIGSAVASGVLKLGWGWSFVVPGFLVIFVGFFVFLFLVVGPNDIGFEPHDTVGETESKDDERAVEDLASGDSESIADGRAVEDLVSGDSESIDDGRAVEDLASEDSEKKELIEQHSHSMTAVGFLEAWRLPGVAPYAISLLFSKFVVYTFLYWLPFYISHTAVAGKHLDQKTASNLSMAFDMGGLFSGPLAGSISDLTDAHAVTSVAFLILSIPALFFYKSKGSISIVTNACLMFVSGLLVNGPYSLISTDVAADLGTQSTSRGNSRALATVTAIIDGTGSLGAAFGPLMVGYVSSSSWDHVFFILYIFIFLATIPLFRLALTDIRRLITRREVIEV